jgi:hypothetical protein
MILEVWMIRILRKFERRPISRDSTCGSKVCLGFARAQQVSVKTETRHLLVTAIHHANVSTCQPFQSVDLERRQPRAVRYASDRWRWVAT